MDISKEKKVRDVMTRGVITVSHDTPMNEIVKILVGKDISGIVVTAPDNEALGVISEIDIIKVMDKDWSSLTAEDIMSQFVRAIDPETTLMKAADTVRELNIHRLLILHRAPGRSYGVPVGVLSASDILRAIVT
ncbi:MAG TPA: CBS domain-containing protein [Methanophagales archaeon]|nr:CBS domain-containing protein [Methanophagales archaeon]